MRRSGIARRGLGAARQTGRPLEAVGNGAQPDLLDAVLALVVGDLARSWTGRRWTRGRVPATVPSTNRRVRRVDMQAARAERRAEPAAQRRIAELPEDYRVVGVERRHLWCTSPGADHSHPAGRPRDRGHAQARQRFARGRLTDQEGDASWHESS